MKNLKTKTITITLLIVLLIINSALLFSYYNFYLTDKISTDIIEAKNENHANLYMISRNIKNKSLFEAVEYIEYHTKKYGGYVSLKTLTGENIYTNKKNINKLFSSTMIIYIDNNEYEFTYSKISLTPGIRLIRNFMFFEIVLWLILVVVAYMISSKQLITPMEIIIKDINNYKYGKIPFKRKMPRNMGQIQNTFVDMVDSLEMEKNYQNQIIASISHDIKTPLTSIMGYANRLKNKELSKDKQEKYIDKIYSKSLLMKEILDEFDDYQSCNIKDTMKFEKYNIGYLCNYLKEEFKDDLQDKKIDLQINSSCDNKLINIDLVKIRRVFGNIINNSVNKFNSNKGNIIIDMSYSLNKVKIEIKDNAGGIKDEASIKKIFEPLYTTDPSRKISGLGLSICKQIILAHEGAIYALNNDINGLSIIIMLPVIKS